MNKKTYYRDLSLGVFCVVVLIFSIKLGEESEYEKVYLIVGYLSFGIGFVFFIKCFLFSFVENFCSKNKSEVKQEDNLRSYDD